MPERRAKRITEITRYFAGENSILGSNIVKLILEFSNNLRIGKHITSITYSIPRFRGVLTRCSRSNKFGKQDIQRFRT
jgi:hypothetical protein